MNIYENFVIFSASLSDDEIKAGIEKISAHIRNAGGEILKVDIWGKRRLAYELQKQRVGIYVLFLFRAPNSTVRKLEENYKLMDLIMKFIIIRLGKDQVSALPKDILGIPVTPQELSAPAEPAIEA